MSAPTVSITANPTRRRQVTVVATDNIPNPASPSADVGDLPVVSGTITTRDPPDPTLSPSRHRRHRKAGKSRRWMRVLVKNLAMLVVVGLLVQMIRRLVEKSRDFSGVEGLVEMEERIAEVEKFTKKTAGLIQMQVDIVDRKVKDGVGELREEFGRVIEGRVGFLDGEVRRLEGRSEELELLVGRLSLEELVSKRDLDRVVKELRKEGIGGGDGNGLSLDEIRGFVKELVESEMAKHAADGLGRVDYALASGGGMVVKHSEVYVLGKMGNWLLKGGRNGVHREAEKILRPSFGQPGQCFPLKGSSGFVQIRLRTAIIPEAITLEHVAKSVAYDRSSAPKECRVSGWLQGHDTEKTPDAEKLFLLTEFTYDLEKSNAQTFDVLDSTIPGIIDTVRLDFTSNYGSSSHTCIYRLRVHGHEPDSVSMMAMQS